MSWTTLPIAYLCWILEFFSQQHLKFEQDAFADLFGFGISEHNLIFFCFIFDKLHRATDIDNFDKKLLAN